MNKKELEKYKVKKTLRTFKTEGIYMRQMQDRIKNPQNYNTCIFCAKELLIKEFKYWMILKNRFPYDRIYEKSHMLAVKRHAASEADLTVNEIMELRMIKKDHLKNYHVLLENVGARISIKDHFHLHILKFKK